MKASNTNALQGKVCACGNQAFKSVGGRREYICERCMKLEAWNATRAASEFCGRGSDARLEWPSIGIFSVGAWQ